MPLLDSDKTRIRQALGYPAIPPALSLALGFPSSPYLLEQRTLLEHGLSNINEDDIPFCLELLGNVEAIRKRLFRAHTHFAAVKVGSIELNPKETAKLRAEYRHWGRALMVHLGLHVSSSWFSPWFAGGGGISGRVRVR